MGRVLEKFKNVAERKTALQIGTHNYCYIDLNFIWVFIFSQEKTSELKKFVKKNLYDIISKEADIHY